ncbi:MAG: thiol:disulfide interchange protein DsbA/DsbL [Gammaproteobacteria bacterium]|nr:thiol:disulfide interchange protein DsbA/DsbL [Gammaproteobacteria bacterium]
MKAIVVAAILGITSGQAVAEAFGYFDIKPAQPTSSGNKIEVVEMFWYGCPHCNQFEPFINSWKKRQQADVAFKRIPAIFNARWELHARAYFTAEVLGVLDKVHTPMFDAIHKQKKTLATQAALAELFARHGVDKSQFNRSFRSFAVNSKVNWAKKLTKSYQIDGVPTMVVAGKYRTSASLAGGHQQVLNVVDDLVKQERR